jgi:hypothetical protein
MASVVHGAGKRVVGAGEKFPRAPTFNIDVPFGRLRQPVEAPAADPVELLELHDVGCVAETTPENFIDMTTLKRSP